MTQSCQATGYAVTSPPPNYINATQTATARTSSPTAHVAEGLDERDALLPVDNNLEAGCTQLPAAGAQLCMPPSCDVYTVQANDTCWGIVDSFTTMCRSRDNLIHGDRYHFFWFRGCHCDDVSPSDHHFRRSCTWSHSGRHFI
ncbi:hypothetical protein diail_3030 [Diaporthe ilicicola]|nr:hypothetical protein diail_3030 [Diaporthe ilicicola]